MIPFASQRGLGQDLAAHLQNQHDNEVMEVAELRGSIADDLHGAFAEWEAQAHALTRCRNYLYSLSINPGPRQGELTREQYRDYIDRVENKLGLSGQPRAIVFHTKHGREHCHAVWSRIDPVNEKAVHLAFDHDKLMMVTREFARDHGLELPDGYAKGKVSEKSPQVSVYEMAQQRGTGLSREDHRQVVTEAWKASDSPAAFMQALADKGYMLATGKRPYVLVDFYGGMHALPKLIADKTVRTRDVRAFLEKDYPPDTLPSVDEAKKLIATHRKSAEAHLKSEQRFEALSELKHVQQVRRQAQEKDGIILHRRVHLERAHLATAHRTQRDEQRVQYLEQTRRIKHERFERRPTGLAGFLARVTGMEAVRKKLHKYQDRKRLRTYLADRDTLKKQQFQERTALQRRQEMQALDQERKTRALNQVEKKEIKSLEESLKNDARVSARGGENQIPALPYEYKIPGRNAGMLSDEQAAEIGLGKGAPHNEREYRQKEQLEREVEHEFMDAAEGRIKQKQINLQEAFNRAAKDGEEEERGSAEGPKPAESPKPENKIQRYGRKDNRDNDLDYER
ncbi:MAG: relaxase/mobilization nuclease domain-containing protein [Candidatus Thiodiazotropha sp. (ex Troendleina suluensis)]|nr:relaxase/mobilization nuclease domain-containing protein [Candidatus Thiodiazotropha sp. (ex Troendleina suluensis)]